MRNTAYRWQVTANMCELLAFSLRYPTAELAEAVQSGEWLVAAHEIASALDVQLSEDFGAEVLSSGKDGEPIADAEVFLRELRAEATCLFVGAPEPACSPYEGVWRAADDGVQALLFVNPHSMAVQRFCAACGMGQPEGSNEPLDHIATEFELLQYLAGVAGGITEPVAGSVAENSLPGGSAESAFERFMSEHVRVWSPRFAEALTERSGLAFYRAVGNLAARFLAL